MNQFAAPNYVWLARVAIAVVLLAALSLLASNGRNLAPYLGAALILAALVLALALRGLGRELARQNHQMLDAQHQLQAEQGRVARINTILGNTDHRIGNALATLSSLLALQAQRTPDPEAHEALDAARSRVHAVASAHRRLRLGPDLETANLAELLSGVMEDLALSRAVQLVGEFEPISV
ncbi:MAG TPA: histidine kinase dimerization/phosphoacceptor domain -containing protein, partial [Devosia sp.]|nr:histidine kinase dimerization/phosphoacceptor domain -containing protein [Devosia sp.]